MIIKLFKNRFNLTIALLLTGTFHLYAQNDNKIEEKIDSIIAELTLEEKVSLCHAQSLFSSAGVPRLGIPAIWMSDGPHGVRSDLNWDNWGKAGRTDDSCTAFPALTCLAATFNPEVSYEYGKAIGEEARYREKDVLLGPGVNIYRTPLNGRNFEYLGEDPFLSSKMVVPYVKGVQQNGVAACLKHYALNNQEKWRLHINVEVDDRALREIYLPAYKAAVQEANVWAIMGAYNKFRGQYCCQNEILLNDILRNEWKFDGVVLTDWGGTHNTMEAIRHGPDIEMGTWTDGLNSSKENSFDDYYLANPFLKLIQRNQVGEDELDAKVRRILRLMYRTNMNNNAPRGSLNSPEHHSTARKIGTEGIVLLKNEGGLLPIDPNRKLVIAVLGENAVKRMTIGGGSSELKAEQEISPLQGIRNRFSKAKVIYSQAYTSCDLDEKDPECSITLQDSLKYAAIETAKIADIVLWVGGLNKKFHMDCEGGDREDYGLPYKQNEIINEILKVNKNLAVLLISGNAVEMPWVDNVKAIMQVWYLGSEAGNALADVLSGDVNPSGKLPFTFPVKLQDSPAHYYGKLSYPGDSINQEYKEGILVGYRWYDTKKIIPNFAFGYGLSYTRFTLNKISLNNIEYGSSDTILVSCTVTNSGHCAGAEVVQVYVGKKESHVERALKELKGFDKVKLEPGASEKITVKIPTKSLSYYDEDESKWKLETGRYEIYVGNSSDNIIKELAFKIID